MSKLYEIDYYGWANEQAALLRAGCLSQADIENIAEEIESMGKGEKRELVNRLIMLLSHLLKWEYQPEKRSKSWRNTIRVQRDQLASHMVDNLSLKARLDEAMADAYRIARIEAADGTDFPEHDCPARCPYAYPQAMSEQFWPGPSHDQ